VGLIGTEAALLGPAEDDAVEAARENFALQRAELEGALMMIVYASAVVNRRFTARVLYSLHETGVR